MAEGQMSRMRDPYQSGQDDGLLQELEMVRKQIMHYRNEANQARMALQDLVLPQERRVLGHLDMAKKLAGQLGVDDGLYLDMSLFGSVIRQLEDQILSCAVRRVLDKN